MIFSFKHRKLSDFPNAFEMSGVREKQRNNGPADSYYSAAGGYLAQFLFRNFMRH